MKIIKTKGRTTNKDSISVPKVCATACEETKKY